MNVQTRRIVATAVAGMAIVGVIGLSSLVAESPSTQPAAGAARSFPFVGHVSGTNVRVRSGPDTNYYPVAKLTAGDEVTVYSEEYGWMSIAPPKGSYSLIDRSFVDKAADGAGIVNAEDVWVRAGSDMDNNRYAKQIKLGKGASVKIIGETEDNSAYKIEPPDGARVWVSSQFIKTANNKAVSAVATPAAKSPAKATTPNAANAKEATRELARNLPQNSVSVSTTRPAIFGPQSEDLKTIDALIEAEMKKPLTQQTWKPIIEKLRPIARQEEDGVSKAYAEGRIKQLQSKADMIAAIGDINTLQKSSEDEHALAAQVRKGITPPAEPVMDGRVEAHGELRPSQVFDMQSEAMPKRFRLVDPSTDRTIAYVEAGDSPIDLNKYLGKYVSVRAQTRRLTSGTVQPISILLPDELAVVEPKNFTPSVIELPNNATASGQPTPGPSTGNPTTRPAPKADKPATTQPAK